MIRFDRVSVRYPRAPRRALDGVSFVVTDSGVTGVAGPNGSGKSTLVRALIRRSPMEDGTIELGGDSIKTLSQREIARRVAVAPQREEAAFPTTVREYVSLGRYPRLGLWEAAGKRDDEAVARALERAGVSELAERRTDELSGGEWQRVRIARALAQEGSALVLDEPTTFLDLAHEMALFELLHSLAADGLAVLVVSHQLNLLARFARDVVILDRGRVAAHGSPLEVMRAPLLEQVYGWPLVVSTDTVTGAPALIPLRQPQTASRHP